MVLGCPQGDGGESNATPILRAAKLDAALVPGGSQIGMDYRHRWAVNPAFASAADAELAPYFQGIVGG